MNDNFSKQKVGQSTTEPQLISIGDGIISTDHQGNIVFLNRIAEFLTGWTQEEAMGKSIKEVYKRHSVIIITRHTDNP